MRHKDKVDTVIESTAEFDMNVEKLREQFRNAEFQHRIEVGEISEALNNFKVKEKMWEEFVSIREVELKELKKELGEDSEEQEIEKEQKVKRKHKRKLKCKKEKHSKDCKKCGISHKDSLVAQKKKTKHSKKSCP